jgi:hypothetical protein
VEGLCIYSLGIPLVATTAASQLCHGSSASRWQPRFVYPYATALISPLVMALSGRLGLPWPVL